jgi:hypothetical protein
MLIATGTSTGIVVEYPGVLIGSTNNGTQDYIAKWTSNNTIGNSIIKEVGSTVTVSGNLSASGLVSESSVLELTTITAAAPAATTHFDVLSQGIQYYTSNTANNWTLNVRGNGSTTLNSILSVGRSVTVTLIATNGSPAFYHTSLTIDGASVTPKWLCGTAPSSGNVNALDTYSFAITKTSNTPTYLVIASANKFA